MKIQSIKRSHVDNQELDAKRRYYIFVYTLYHFGTPTNANN